MQVLSGHYVPLRCQAGRGTSSHCEASNVYLEAFDKEAAIYRVGDWQMSMFVGDVLGVSFFFNENFILLLELMLVFLCV